MLVQRNCSTEVSGHVEDWDQLPLNAGTGCHLQ